MLRYAALIAFLGLMGCSPAPRSAPPTQAAATRGHSPGQLVEATGPLTKEEAMLAIYGAAQPWVSEDDRDKPLARYRTFAVPPKISEGQPRYYRIQPEILVQVGDRWALVSGLSLPDAQHVDIGLVAIHYLRRERGRWAVVGAWPWFMGGNGFGDAGDFTLRQDLLPGPTLLWNTGYSGMGQSCSSTTVVELTPKRPIVRAGVMMEYEYLPTKPGGEEHEDEMRVGFTGTLEAAGGQGFKVRYRGEQGPRTVTYRLVPGQDEMTAANPMGEDNC